MTPIRAVRARTDDDQDAYMSLVQEFPLRPIRDDSELSRASEIADRLALKDELASAEEDYLEVLDGLIQNYERENHPIQPIGDSDLLRELLAARPELTQRQLAEKTGIVYSTISAVLAGKRTFTRDQVVAIAHYFHVDPGSFLASESR